MEKSHFHIEIEPSKVNITPDGKPASFFVRVARSHSPATGFFCVGEAETVLLGVQGAAHAIAQYYESEKGNS